jgi:hypothetical protein
VSLYAKLIIEFTEMSLYINKLIKNPEFQISRFWSIKNGPEGGTSKNEKGLKNHMGVGHKSIKMGWFFVFICY